MLFDGLPCRVGERREAIVGHVAVFELRGAFDQALGLLVDTEAKTGAVGTSVFGTGAASMSHCPIVRPLDVRVNDGPDAVPRRRIWSSTTVSSPTRFGSMCAARASRWDEVLARLRAKH